MENGGGHEARPRCWVYAVCAKNLPRNLLLEELEDTLGNLVGLGQHGLGALEDRKSVV